MVSDGMPRHVRDLRSAVPVPERALRDEVASEDDDVMLEAAERVSFYEAVDDDENTAEDVPLPHGDHVSEGESSDSEGEKAQRDRSLPRRSGRETRPPEHQGEVCYGGLSQWTVASACIRSAVPHGRTWTIEPARSASQWSVVYKVWSGKQCWSVGVFQ